MKSNFPSLVSRRHFLQTSVVASVAAATGMARDPGSPAPPGPQQHAEKILRALLRRSPEALTLDWFGTFPIIAMLRWADRGFPQVRDYAKAWFDFHAAQPPGTLVGRAGSSTRICQLTHVSIRTYAGYWGTAMAAEGVYRATGDPRARTTAIDVGDAILHQVRRHGNGLIAHDDQWDWQIPDVAFFACDALAAAARLAEPAMAAGFRRQARYQLQRYVDTTLDRSRGLAHTALLADGRPGQTYWCRATGWLMWALCAGLRDTPRTDSATAPFREALAMLAAGVRRVISPNGGLHVMLDRPDTPEEVSSACMVATALHEALARGWVGGEHRATVERLRGFILRQIRPDDRLASVYVKWARPLEEKREVDVQAVPLDGFGPAIGMLLLALRDMV